MVDFFFGGGSQYLRQLGGLQRQLRRVCESIYVPFSNFVRGKSVVKEDAMNVFHSNRRQITGGMRIAALKRIAR
jgi:hypothetical protein